MSEKHYIDYSDVTKTELQKKPVKYKIYLESRLDTVGPKWFKYDDDPSLIKDIDVTVSTEGCGGGDFATITIIDSIETRAGTQGGFFVESFTKYDRINDTIAIEFTDGNNDNYKRVFTGIITKIDRVKGYGGGAFMRITCASPAAPALEVASIPDTLGIKLWEELMGKLDFCYTPGAAILKYLLYIINMAFYGFGHARFKNWLKEEAVELPDGSNSIKVPNPIVIETKEESDAASDTDFIKNINIDSSSIFAISDTGGDTPDAFTSAKSRGDLLSMNYQQAGDAPWSKVSSMAKQTGREIWFEHDITSIQESSINSDDNNAGAISTPEKKFYEPINKMTNENSNGTKFLLRYRFPNFFKEPKYTINSDLIIQENFTESSTNIPTAIYHLKGFFDGLLKLTGKGLDLVAKAVNLLFADNKAWAAVIGTICKDANKGLKNANAVSKKTAERLIAILPKIIKYANLIYITGDKELSKRLGVRMLSMETSTEIYFMDYPLIAKISLLIRQYQAKTCSVNIIGDPKIKIGNTIRVIRKTGKASDEKDFTTEKYKYYIKSVKHNWSLQNGFTTVLTLTYGSKENDILSSIMNFLQPNKIENKLTDTQILSDKQNLGLSSSEVISDVRVDNLVYSLLLATNNYTPGQANIYDVDYWRYKNIYGEKIKNDSGGIQFNDKNITNKFDKIIYNNYDTAKAKYSGMIISKKEYLSWVKAMIGYLSNSTQLKGSFIQIDSDGRFGIFKIAPGQLAFISSEYKMGETILKGTTTNSEKMNLMIGCLLFSYYLQEFISVQSAIYAYLSTPEDVINNTVPVSAINSFSVINSIRDKINKKNFFQNTTYFIYKPEGIGIMNLSSKESEDPNTLEDLYDPMTNINQSKRKVKDWLQQYDSYYEVSTFDKVRGIALAHKYYIDDIRSIDIDEDKDFQQKVVSNYYRLVFADYNQPEEDDTNIEYLEYGDYALPMNKYFLSPLGEDGRFGSISRFYGYPNGNAGIDLFSINGKTGDDIFAVYNGYVHRIANNENLGTVIWLYHPELNRYSGYGHVNDTYKNAGDLITKGDIIGTVGRTATNENIKTFLHFEWSAIDPVETKSIPSLRIDPETIIDFDSLSYGNINVELNEDI